jgi:hypothetical protein
MRPGAEPIKNLDSLILYLHNDIWFVMVKIKIFPVIAIQLTPLQNQAVQVDPRLNFEEFQLIIFCLNTSHVIYIYIYIKDKLELLRLKHLFTTNFVSYGKLGLPHSSGE